MEKVLSQTTECNKIINLSHVIDTLDGHNENQYWTFPLMSVDKMQISAVFYPKYSAGTDGYCALFIQINPKPKPKQYFCSKDHRIFAMASCGDAKVAVMNKSLEEWITGTGWGWPTRFSLDVIKKHKQITIRLVFHQTISSAKSTSSLFITQLDSMYNMSILNGDVTLVIKPNEDNDLYVPANKKRKLNEFECHICMKTFNSSKGLKSHMSNKRDAAHKNRNSNTIELNEIKMCSTILRSASPVFNAILSTNMIEQQEKRIEVCANNVKDVDDLLYFMCTNKLRYDCDALSLIELAHYYQMDRLICNCTNKLIEIVCIDNFVRIINMFDKYRISDGYGYLVDFGKKNAEKLKEKDNFDEISHSLKCILLDSIKRT